VQRIIIGKLGELGLITLILVTRALTVVIWVFIKKYGPMSLTLLVLLLTVLLVPGVALF